MSQETIKLTVEGLPAEGGHVRLRDFLQGLENLGRALSTTDRLISRGNKQTLYYRIVSLSHSSPATVEIEPVCTNANLDTRLPVVHGFIDALAAIHKGDPVPRWVTSDLLTSLEKISRPVGQTVKSAMVSSNRSSFEINSDFRGKVERMLSAEDHVLGSVEGRLDKINVHAGTNTFEIYPSIGPTSIRCHFPAKLEHIAITSVKRWVTVIGTLTYRALDKFPSLVEASAIEVHPSAEDLPGLDDLRGVAPKATGKMTSDVFIRQLRDEWG